MFKCSGSGKEEGFSEVRVRGAEHDGYTRYGFDVPMTAKCAVCGKRVKLLPVGNRLYEDTPHGYKLASHK